MDKNDKLEIMIEVIEGLKLDHGIDLEEEWKVFYELIKEKNIDHSAMDNYLNVVLPAKFEKERRKEQEMLTKERENREKKEERHMPLEPSGDDSRRRRSSVSRDRSKRSESRDRRSVSASKSRNSRKSLSKNNSYASIDSKGSWDCGKSGRKTPSNFGNMNYKIAFLEDDQDIFVPDNMIAADEMSLVSCVRDLVRHMEKNDAGNFKAKKPVARTLMNINLRNRRGHQLQKKDVAIHGSKKRKKSRNPKEFR